MQLYASLLRRHGSISAALIRSRCQCLRQYELVRQQSTARWPNRTFGQAKPSKGLRSSKGNKSPEDSVQSNEDTHREDSSRAYIQNLPMQQSTRYSTPKRRKTVLKERVSLADQLFPGVFGIPEQHDQSLPLAGEREVPRLPLDFLDASTAPKPQPEKVNFTPLAKSEVGEHASPGTELSHVLRFENASKNLTIADFRRIIPQGKHLEGWTLGHGDIIKVVPGRSARTLKQTDFYYLVFSSASSARAYEQHAKRLHALTQQRANGQEPWGLPLEMLNKFNMDVPAAIASLTAINTGPTLRLPHLLLPLTPQVEEMLDLGGLDFLMRRSQKKRFELRMSLDGPQIAPTTLRYILTKSGMVRGLPWSGQRDSFLQITAFNLSTYTFEPLIREETHRDRVGVDKTRSWKTEPQVYIVGFDTEDAAQSFLHYWHRRPLEDKTDIAMSIGSDSPPIVDLQALW